MKLRAAVWFAMSISAGLVLPPAASAGPAGPAVLAAKKKAKGNAGVFKRTFHLLPRGVQWGISLKDVARIQGKALDRAFAPRLRKAQPGVQMRAIEEELRDVKALIKRNFLKFGSVPTGIDSTPLKGEYSYRNGESMTRLTLPNGVTRHYFFFNDKLWKVYDEHPFGKKSSIGSNYDEAVEILGKKFKAEPKVVEPDYKAQMMYEAQWRNEDFVVRAINRGKDLVAVVYEDRSISENLDKHRANKPADPNKLDSSVEDALR